ncbi:68_t:CDS:2 [Dentiscutata heterogama]|uniref:68_t:CDS:1 n=1 Tax=Dentiscutata heterogama TaxID=1316150 RepID=A0ACA9KQU8_9GLOM|nr:68_t:CDS:2 [Dentiscutata heterogama]
MNELLSKKSPLLSDKQQPLSLDKDPLLLDNELSLNEPSIDSKPVLDEKSLLLLEGLSNSTQNTIRRLSKTGPLLPLSGKKEIAQLRSLQKDLAKDKERNVKNNAKALEKLLLDDDDLLEIQELVELLGSFAYVTTIVGGDHCSTFLMILPLVRILQKHLYQKEETPTHPIIRDVYNKIELSFGECWEEPRPEGYVAAMLDPRFKDLGFELAKFESTKDELKCRMMKYTENNNYFLPNNNLPTSLLSSLFEETTHQLFRFHVSYEAGSVEGSSFISALN